ncbi:MFS monosaccharide transporter-like protein [Dothidotthia symphoricarpi CBS 119687]|uniref:MFS monosaccharide transporter-like protein n=1 Tax=Dothidotthia symphoricarpi CBS 119687 TaxID=1392245 RepID=A0A6A6A760_9PLEO|nr:MFS monosaccharide transporter-like protein [Dothidotthia symphoricarpi CBS 119687]KAF2127055.1 MFS monosaccharide transporter-like protein [Dothidotthia symphoricarpi CBS 119687]
MVTTNTNLDYATRGPVVRAVSAVTLALCTLFVVLRLVSRFYVVRKAGWDDYTMILAWIFAVGASFSIIYGSTKGLGRHQDDIPDQWMDQLQQSSYAFSVIYNPALMATKTSILVFYLNLSKTHKVFRWATIATLVVVNAGGLALTLLNVFQCSPASAAWQSPIPASSKCTNIVTVYLSSAPLNIITDMAIIFLPMPILTSMRLPKKQKIILVVTFGVGIFVAVVDVVRIAYLQDASRAALRAAQGVPSSSGTDQRNASDFSWYSSLSFMWSVVEINLGIMCGCVPALKPLVRRFLPAWVIDQTLRDYATTRITGYGATRASDDIVLHPDIVDSRRRSDPPMPPESPIIKPLPARTSNDQSMGMMDFLTTPDMKELPPLRNTNTVVTHATAPTHHHHSMAFFDFVDMGKKKNITLRSNRESVYPVLMVTILFFVWGFAYGLLAALNSRFQEVAHMSDWETVGEHSAYYAGYFIGPLTFGRPVFRVWGFKACYMVGLIIYACGCLTFWPAAVLASFPAFLISNFITGLGLSTLELSANPFIALCGPPEYAEVRLNLSQAVQATGTVVSPLLAKKVLFTANGDNLIDVQWTYLGIAFFNVVLAIIYFYVPLPEATDEELEAASARMPVPRNASVNGGSKPIRVIWVGLGLAVWSVFCYVGGQEATASLYGDYLRLVKPSLDAVDHQAVGHSAFAVSRFLAAIIDIWVKPRFSLLFFYLGAIAFSAAAMHSTGSAAAAILVMVMFFEGPLFPQLFAQGIRGMGKHTKDASVLLTAAIGGGGVMSPIMFAALKTHNARYAFCVIVTAFSAGVLYPLWLSALPATRKLSDPIRDHQTRLESVAEQEGRESMGQTRKGRWSKVRRRFSLNKEKDQLPSVEHRERCSWPEGSAPISRSLDISPMPTHAKNSWSKSSTIRGLVCSIERIVPQI